MTLVTCQLVRKGRFVVGEPYFDPGTPVTVANGKQFMGDAGKLAVVAATRTVGRVVEVLGDEGNLHGVLRGLLAEAGSLGEAPPPGVELGSWPGTIQDQLDELPSTVPLVDEREDLRSQLCVTIDPPDARDHDDAIGIEVLGDDGSVAIWVHIADVAAYVPPGSPIDLEAFTRANSVYVPGQVAPMLPHQLSSDLCSLRPGVDRGCVSTRIELDSRARVREVRFARSLIRSARRLSYDQVDELLARGVSIEPVVDGMLGELDRISALLRQARMERGALDLALGEVRFELDERTVRGATLEPESPSHRLVEECMLLANEAVGSRLARAQAPALWRVHDHPDPVAIEALVAMFEELGVPTPPIPEQMSGADAARVAGEIVRVVRRYSETSGRGRLAFAPRILRALQQATYQPHPGPHSGLATRDYSHFTSPIRRYPDLVAHRALLGLIGASDDAPSTVDLATVASHASQVEREAMKLERRADDIARAHLLHDRLFGAAAYGPDAPTNQWRGEVTGMIERGAFVRFGDVFEGFLPARTIGDGERYELEESGVALVGQRSGHRLRLGDPVDVWVAGVDRAAGKVELRLVGRDGDDVRTGRARRGGQQRGGRGDSGNGRYRRAGGGRRSGGRR